MNQITRIYKYQPVDLTELLKNHDKETPFPLCDKYFFSYTECDSITPYDFKGHGLNINNDTDQRSLSESKIENVYFLRGATFDRQYFRRSYPNISIRKDPKYADIILYDDKSLQKNRKKPNEYRVVCDTETLIDVGIDKYGSIPHIDRITNLFIHLDEDGVSKQSNFIWDHKQSVRWNIASGFNNSKLSTHNSVGNYSSHLSNLDTLRYLQSVGINLSVYSFKISDDKKESYLIRRLIKSVKNKEYMKWLSAATPNEYYSLLNSVNKPYMKISEFYKIQESKSDENDLSYEECMSLWAQLNSNDERIFITAAESLIQYNAKKYIPIQSLLLIMSNINFSYLLKSKKVNLFINSHKQWFVQSLRSGNDKLYVSDIKLSGYYQKSTLQSWSELFDSVYLENKDKYDLNLIKRILYGSSLLKDYLKIGQKIGFEINNYYIMKNLNVKNIDWSLKSTYLSNETIYNQDSIEEMSEIPKFSTDENSELEHASATPKSMTIDDEFGI